MNINLKAMPGPRTLILTHLRKKEPRSLRMSTALWQLKDPAFPDGRPFEKRLSLVEEGGDLPGGVDVGVGDLKIFSWTGAINDGTPPHAYRASTMEFLPASQLGYAQPGEQQFLLGGGNLEFCLKQTFHSLISVKTQQNEPLQVIISLAFVYWSSDTTNIFRYISNENHFTWILNKLRTDEKIRSYLITLNGRYHDHSGLSDPTVELHWFTSNRDMFASPLFPEVADQASVQRLINYFAAR
jgi:hypothetical protein